MTDDRREEIPLVPRDAVGRAASPAPQATSLPDANRRKLEALLRELLRDESMRALLCSDEEHAEPVGRN
jgi:hypothetical protein